MPISLQKTAFLNPVSAFSTSAGGTRAWTTPTGIEVLTGAAAVASRVSAGAVTNWLIAEFSPNLSAVTSAFGNNIDVQGFEVRYLRKTANVAWTGSVDLALTSGANSTFEFKSGNAIGVSAVAASWTTSYIFTTAGNSTAMWGMTTANASAGRLDSGRFGVAIRVSAGGTTLTSAAAMLDLMQLRIWYDTKRLTVTQQLDKNPATDTGWLVPTSVGTNDAGQPGGVGTWANANNAKTSDDSYAVGTQLSGVGTIPLFAFLAPSIPVNAEVQGFNVQYEVHRGDSDLSNVTFNAYPGTETVHPNGLASVSAIGVSDITDTTLSADASSNLAGWTTADASAGLINGGTFGFGFTVQSDNSNPTSGAVFVDALWLKIFYSTNRVWYQHEIQSVGVSNVFNIVVQPSDYNHEIQSVALSKNVVVTPSDYQHEIQSVSLTQTDNIVVQSGQWDFEIQSVSLSISGTILVTPSDYQHEIQSVSLTQTDNIVVQSGEYDTEIQSASLSNNIVIQSGQYDFEIQSVSLSNNIVVQSGEWAHEIKSVALQQTFFVNPNSGQWDFEIKSVLITQGVFFNPISSEYDTEIQSVGITQIYNVNPLSSEYDFEVQSDSMRRFISGRTSTFRRKTVRAIFTYGGYGS